MIFWDEILNWFSDTKSRNSFLKEWNIAARDAYIVGDVPTLLEAKTTIGTIEWRHEFSKFMAGGFRVKTLSGKDISKLELIEIGNTIINNKILVRKLVSNGYDTLELEDSSGNLGCKWQLKNHSIISNNS